MFSKPQKFTKVIVDLVNYVQDSKVIGVWTMKNSLLTFRCQTGPESHRKLVYGSI